MTRKASLIKVSTFDNVAIFRIEAPAVAAVLTRSGGFGSPKIIGRILNAVIPPVDTAAVKCQVESTVTFRKGASGKWYVRIEGVPTHEEKSAAPAVQNAVADTNTVVKGHHTCVRCNGTGVVASSRDNGKCYRCKGKGYTTIIDRQRNAAHGAFRKARIEAIRTAHANA